MDKFVQTMSKQKNYRFGLPGGENSAVPDDMSGQKNYRFGLPSNYKPKSAVKEVMGEAVDSSENVIDKAEKSVGFIDDIVKILDAPIVSPRIDQAIDQVTGTQKLAGTLNALVGGVETLFSPVSKLFQMGTRSLTEIQSQIENVLGLDKGVKVGELIDKGFQLAAESPQAGAEFLDKGFEGLGVPRDVLNLGLSEKDAQPIAEAIGGGSSLLAQVLLAKGFDAGVKGLKPKTETFKPAEIKSTEPSKLGETEQIKPDAIKEGGEVKQIIPDAAKQTADLPTIEEIKTPKISKEIPEDVTGIKKSVIDTERTQRGLPPIERETRASNPETWDLAKQKIEKGEIKPDVLSKEIINRMDTDNPKVLSRVEEAALMYDRMKIKNEYNKVRDKVIEAQKKGDAETEISARIEENLLKENYELNDQALRAHGTEAGRAFQFLQRMVNEDYNLLDMTNEWRKKFGEDPSPALAKKFEIYDAQIKKLQSELDITKDRLKEVELKKLTKRFKDEESYATRKRGRKLTSEELTKEWDDLSKQLYKLSGQLNTGIPTEAIPIIGKMAKNATLRGANTIEGLVDAVYIEAKKYFNDIDKRMIRDTITGYGRETKPNTRSELQKELASMKSEGRAISKLEDIQQKGEYWKRNNRTSVPNERLSKLEEEIKTEMKKKGIPTDLSKLETRKKQIQSLAKEYERKIKNKEYAPKEEPLVDNKLLDLQSELIKVKDTWRENFDREQRSRRKPIEKFRDTVIDILGLPRSAFKVVLDLSMPLRQGRKYNYRFPKQVPSWMGQMLKNTFSEKAYQRLESLIENHPDKKYFDRHNLYLAKEKGSRFQEEVFSNELADKIPIWSKFVVRPSQRAANTYMNLQRLHAFETIKYNFEKQGFSINNIANKKLYDDLASQINTFTMRGIGKKGGLFERNTYALNQAIFSPRNFKATVQALNPLYYLKMERPAQIEAARTMGTYILASTTVLGLAKMAGLDVELNPLSADWGKAKKGDTRIDLLGGDSQYIRTVVRTIYGKRKTESGEIIETNRLTELGRYGRGKLSPPAGITVDALAGESMLGEKVTPGYVADQLITPMAAKDVYEVINDLGWTWGIGMGALGVLGAGLQTYPERQDATKSMIKPIKAGIKPIKPIKF